MVEERRRNRSKNAHSALGLQLASCAARARLSALILAEDQGLTVATTGNVEEIEEIAAMAPSLARDSGCWHGSVQTVEGIKSVTVCPIPTELGRLFLCAVGRVGSTIDTELIRSGVGVRRILH
ncbi:MAG: hypothetical protein JRF63_08935 [Deltaproteobacteria bacterium]|nr:hypothetical protein [Deltaproteobacteria bacterium]